MSDSRTTPNGDVAEQNSASFSIVLHKKSLCLCYLYLQAQVTKTFFADIKVSQVL